MISRALIDAAHLFRRGHAPYKNKKTETFLNASIHQVSAFLFLHGLLPSRKIKRETLRVSSGHLFAKQRSNDRAGGERSNLRSPVCARLTQKNQVIKALVFCIKKARGGDRTRDPLLGKEVLHR